MAPSLFKSICLLVMTEYCYNEFFINFNFLHVDCLKALISKGLGYGIILGSIFVKVPQILKILNAKSAEGISLTGTSLEVFAILSNVAYSFVNRYPFSAYGDGFFLLLQTALVGFFVLLYGGKTQEALLYFATVLGFLGVLCSGFVPMTILWTLQASIIPVIVTAKTIQAWTNYTNGNTGQLSVVTFTLLFFGSLARIFTSIQETGDIIIIATYSVGSFVNFIVLSQILYYWNVPTKIKGKKKLLEKKTK
ncbi:Mannose-P-dolichol utilization defect 1-like protein [Armadillidium nasatum]|uniref:Mannose-P-dolichol utilization defect 1 protein homolog n=1 Tax=Armadillidium nasatum TaxID=96803 RepID=A0A5N5TP28_9CRUS|nr:Mannose-P-dolichol utilization defect 1-like protein [Armadillidium nasatum]